MRSCRKQVQQMAIGLAFWMILAGLARSQNAASMTESPVSVSQPSNRNCPEATSGVCREIGNSNPPNLALPPEAWPSPSEGMTRDQFDPLKTQCPDKDDYFIIPPRPSLYVVADGAAIHRAPSSGVEFAAVGLLPLLPSVTVNAPTAMVLSTADFNYDFAGAGHLLIGHTINECLQLEAEYTGVTTASNAEAVRDTTPNAINELGNLFSPFSAFGYLDPIAGLDYNNYARIRYDSSLQSIELNIRRQVPMPPEQLTVSVLFGVRYIGLPEDFYYDTTSGVVYSAGGPIPGSANTRIHVATDSQMVGPQIGALFEFYAENRWWVNVEIKAAVLNNEARQTTTYHNVGGGPYEGDHVYTVKEDHTSFAGELALTCVYRWSPRFTTRLGYKALWLTSAVLAQDNFNPDINMLVNGPADLNHNSGIVYHGPFAGVEFAW
jgi:hypothetical protein